MFAIAIDGPAGAGKSTIAKACAEKLQLHYVDTGAMYRTIALALMRRQIDFSSETEVSAALEKLELEVFYADGIQQMIVNGENVTGQIRTAQVGEGASIVAVYAAVRERVLLLERALSQKYEVIMDGRDIGTAVLVDAPLKIYLTADAAERGRRRFLELEEKNPGRQTLEEVIAQVVERDERDMNRAIAPLRKASDAVEIDSTGLSIDEVVSKVLTLAEEIRNE